MKGKTNNFKVCFLNLFVNALWFVTIFWPCSLFGQQFINGNLNPRSDLLGNWGAECSFFYPNQEYIDLVRLNDPTSSCFASNDRATPHVYLKGRVVGFDTLNLVNRGEVALNYPVFNSKRDFNNLYLTTGLNIDTMQHFGWSLELNRQIEADETYILSVLINQDDYVGRFSTVNEFPYDPLNFFKGYAEQWYIRIGLSENPNSEGDSIGKIEMSDYWSTDTTFFEYRPQFSNWEERMSLFYRHHRFRSKFNSGQFTGNYLTFSVIATGTKGSFITSNRDEFTCLQFFEYNDVTLKMDNFMLECPPEIMLNIDSCFENGLKISTQSPSRTHYLWSNGDTSKSIIVENPGTFWVQTESAGCYGYDTIVIDDIKRSVFEVTDYEVCEDSVLVIQGAQNESKWYVNNEIVNVGSSFNFLGVQSTQMLVFSPRSCKGWDTLNIRVLPCEMGSIYFPNAFSPNNDGINDIYQIIGSKSATFAIYNLWGEKLYEGDHWDGRFKGQLSPTGSYISMVTFLNGFGFKSSHYQLIQLIR